MHEVSFHISLVARTSSGAHVSPSRDQAAAISWCTAWRQRNSPNVGVQRGGSAQLDQHDVIVQSIAVETGMSDDLRGVDELLSALKDINVVLTQTHLDTSENRDKWLLVHTENIKC